MVLFQCYSNPVATMSSTDRSLKSSLLFQSYEASNFWTLPNPFYFCSNTKQSLPECISLLSTLLTAVANSQSPLWRWKLVKHLAWPFQLSPEADSPKALPSLPTALHSPTFHLSVCATAIQMPKPMQCILGVWFFSLTPPHRHTLQRTSFWIYQVINTSCLNE